MPEVKGYRKKLAAGNGRYLKLLGSKLREGCGQKGLDKVEL